MAKAKRQPDIETLIRRAVEAGIKAGQRAPDNAYKATERRLYALPVLVKSVAEKRARLKYHEEHGLDSRSRDFVRFNPDGRCLDRDDILEVLIKDLKARIAADEHEIETVKTALKQIKEDEYYLTVEGRYIKQMSDAEIAKQVPCDTTTVWRQRKRLVRIVAVWLYGAEAV
jgi:hypothetical protein